MPRRSLTGLPPGVSSVKGLFQARITWRGQRFSLGYYSTPEQAGFVYRQIRAELDQWADLQMPPPTLHPLLNRRRLARQAAEQAEVDVRDLISRRRQHRAAQPPPAPTPPQGPQRQAPAAQPEGPL